MRFSPFICSTHFTHPFQPAPLTSFTPHTLHLYKQVIQAQSNKCIRAREEKKMHTCAVTPGNHFVFLFNNASLIPREEVKESAVLPSVVVILLLAPDASKSWTVLKWSWRQASIKAVPPSSVRAAFTLTPLSSSKRAISRSIDCEGKLFEYQGHKKVFTDMHTVSYSPLPSPLSPISTLLTSMHA
jgi:hypothetical protein